MSIIHEIREAIEIDIEEYGYRGHNNTILLIPNERLPEFWGEALGTIASLPLDTDEMIQRANSLADNLDDMTIFGYPVVFRTCDEIMLVEDDRI